MDGQDIRMARKEAGLSAKELAERIGVSDATIYGWENDKWNPAEDKKTALRKLLFDGSVTPSEEMQREKELSAGEPVDAVEDEPIETDQEQEHDQETHADKAETEQAEPDDHTCEECSCGADEQNISPEKRQELLLNGFKRGIEYSMDHLKRSAKTEFWNGKIDSAKAFRCLHSLLKQRVQNLNSQ